MAEIGEKEVDGIVAEAMHAFDVPGMAVAVVRNGEVVHCKGYGFRELGKSDPVTADTQFAIASCTKAFTSAATAMLVDEKKMAWDDPVRKHIPFFQLSNPCSDKLITVRDLLSHRTGLGRNDLLWLGTTCSREEIIRRAMQLEISKPIRGHYEYNNLMYTAAGYTLGEASGLGYEGFLRSRIFEPLGMTATLSVTDAQQMPDHATPHALDPERKIIPIPWLNIDNVCPTGGINASASDMSRWLRFQLAGGVWEGQRLVSEENLKVTRTPLILSEVADEEEMPSLFAYAMGWQIFDQMGVKVVTHSGGIDGFTSETTLLPRLNLGFTVLCNVGRPAPRAVRRALVERFGGFALKKTPLQRTMEEEAKEISETERRNEELMASKVAGKGASRPLADFVGTYHDDAYGELTFSVEESGATMKLHEWRYTAEPLHYDTFLVRLDVPEIVPLGTLTFETGRTGSVAAARWIVKGWEVDRRFVRKPA